MKKIMYYILGLTIIISGNTLCKKSKTEIQKKTTKVIQKKLLFNSKIYTSDPNNPTGQAILIDGQIIKFLGSDEEAKKLSDSETYVYNMNGSTILPGFIDTHTHPGLVAVLGDGKEEDPIPQTSHEDIMKWLKKYSRDNLFTPLITAGSWPTDLYVPEGPNKKELDKIVRFRPVLLFDDSGHSIWANSTMLWLMGVNKDTPDPSPGLSSFVRDSNGELTGWIKEFAAVPFLTKFLMPDKEELIKNLSTFLNFLSKKGVTTLFDGGNLLSGNDIYSALSEMDKKGLLPVRYQGSYHIIFPEQIKNAIKNLYDLKTKYEGKRLKFNTIKIHFDGVSEIQTAAMIEPYSNKPDTKGKTLFNTLELTEFIIKLNEKAIDLHLHVVGDQAARTSLDAVESARKQIGPLKIMVTLSHLESVTPQDIIRFKKLNVAANFTPHWFGCYFGNGINNLGKIRARDRQMVRSFLNAGALVTFSSDVTTYSEMDRSNPFLGMHIAMTRKEPGQKGTPCPPAGQVIDLKNIINAYTINGAKQLKMESELGSLKKGKKADLVIIKEDFFHMEKKNIHSVVPETVMMDGEIIQGSLPKIEN